MLAWLVATGDPRPLTYRVIAAMVLVIAVGLVWNPLLGVLVWVALALIVPAVFAAGIAASIMLVQIARARGEQRRAKEAELAHNLLWAIFAAGLPATAAGVYLNGVSLFCF